MDDGLLAFSFWTVKVACIFDHGDEEQHAATVQ